MHSVPLAAAQQTLLLTVALPDCLVCPLSALRPSLTGHCQTQHEWGVPLPLPGLRRKAHAILGQHGVPPGRQPGLSRASAFTRARQPNIFADSDGGCLLSCSLDYQDVVTDGFYDLHGDFSPELERDVFPSLAALRALKLHVGDKREVSRARSVTFVSLPVAPADERWPGKANAFAALAVFVRCAASSEALSSQCHDLNLHGCCACRTSAAPSVANLVLPGQC